MKYLKQISVVLFCISMFTIQAQDEYVHGPSSRVYEGIPKGVVTKHSWESTVFENTIRDYYVYVPAQYDGSQDTALMIFQDGHSYVDLEGDFKVPTVFDNLIAQGKMPVTIGLFINPGHDKDAPATESPWQVTNRSFEYDDVTGLYGDFLLKEMIPELKKTYNISDDPKMRAIGGLSSGAICAFSAAWFHPEAFQKVMSHFGSYADIRGGHNYPPMIRKNDKKDIKIFMQDGSNDLDIDYGNWWLSNLQMESAFKYKDYDHMFVAGTGGHSGKHAGSILPESLVWLWSDVVKEKVNAQVYTLPEEETHAVIMQGETTHFNDMVFDINYMSASENKTLFNKEKEQIIIVKDGELKVSVKGKTKTIGSNSVMLVIPGDKGKLTAISNKVSYYQMTYAADVMNLKRGKEEGSTIYDFDEIEFNEHDRGGIRNYFHRKTAMCPYYEMHVTNLNAGIKSHEPHTHAAAEIILMIKGETQMEIGNKIYPAKAGDVYYTASNIPHAIRNLGDEQCMYFAFQWD